MNKLSSIVLSGYRLKNDAFKAEFFDKKSDKTTNPISAKVYDFKSYSKRI